MIKTCYWLAAVGLSSTSLFALESGMHAGALAHELDRLSTTGRVLYVAAHPDDENTRLLSYLANARHLAAVYLSMTRGGGGQNLIGSEQGVLLDAIRTEELLAARRLDGASQRFTRMRDFGYSKSAAETLSVWNHAEALADVVWVIRTFQPDLIIARFDEQPPNHGHHTASAILAREAFVAAADPKRFPDQLQRGARVWQATRLFRNLSSWRNDPIPPEAISLTVGSYDPRLGLSYGELAALSRSQHKSQGFGVPGDRSAAVERFLVLAGQPAKSDLFEGVALGWERYGRQAEPFSTALDAARRALDRDHPERALPMLVEAHRALTALPDEPRVRDARQTLERVIVRAAGLFVRVNADKPVVVPGGKLKLTSELVLRRETPFVLRAMRGEGMPPATFDESLSVGQLRTIESELQIPDRASISVPAWLAAPPLAGRHQVLDETLRAQPVGPPAASVEFEIEIAGLPLVLQEPVVFEWVDPVHGERLRPLLIVPPATLTPQREAVLFPYSRPNRLAVRVRSGQDQLRGEVRVPTPAGWKLEPAVIPVELAKVGDETTVEFSVTPGPKAEPVTVQPELLVGQKRWSYREDRIDYPHIPFQLVLQQAAVRLVPLQLEAPAGRIGYIKGSGDSVAEDLAHVGLEVEQLDDTQLKSGDLARYRAIIVGVRAFNARDTVRAAHGRLMRYVESGGTLLLQYNTNNWLAPMTDSLGPYPLEIGRDRITDERAAMTPLLANHPALNYPHAISTADFDGWVQERGIYFASKWDPRYEPLFSSADPGEAAVTGSTLVTAYGKGRYVYTGLAFFRQLPAGVPGAYRLLINLVTPPAR
jgi:LmbE family N-acetylglucosaminyl deacetylase